MREVIVDKQDQELVKYSGKLESIFEDGTIMYNGKRGFPSEFPLTQAEIIEIENCK